MAINRAEHPVTVEEAVRVLRSLADNIAEDARTNMRFGDTRPEVLRWAADRLEVDSAKEHLRGDFQELRRQQIELVRETEGRDPQLAESIRRLFNL